MEIVGKTQIINPMDFQFITEDWKNIPVTTKYSFAFGSFLIFLTWLVDHWGMQASHRLFGWDFRNLFFSLGVAIIILTFIPLLWTQAIFWSRRVKYLEMYQPNHYSKDGWETYSPNGREIYILDHRNQESSWIANEETFRDLGFPLPKPEDQNRNDENFKNYTKLPHIIIKGVPRR